GGARRCVAGEPLAARLTSLEESRLRALELFSDAKLRLGRHAELISDLKTLTAENPLHEGFHTRLMITLYRAGRRTEALDVYHKLRRVLCDDLGLDPSPVVDRTYQALISSDPALEADFPAAGTGAVTLRGLGSPAQLPPDIGDFAGHERLLERAERWLTGSDHRTAVPVLAVSGMPGIGKTAFALRLAHRLAPSFPDGQLYHRLREPDGTQTSSAAVLTSFLRGAGLSTEDIPDGVDELQKAFRTWCSGRSLLLVLDDAVSVRQILPLLPGYARCAVVITSRERLHAVPGARTVTLSPLSLQQGSELLAQLIGRDRFRATPEMSETVVRLCAGNPSALRCAGAAIAARNWSTATYARRLAESRSRLDEFAMGDEDLRSRFAASFRTLDAGEQLVFTTVAGLAGPEFTAAQIAEAARLSPDIADLILLKLVDRNLVDTVPGGPPPRYAMPELLRLYAAELAAAPEGEAPGDRHVLMLGGLSRRAHLGV
ncbi:BTAD domain-containing putative transcriptional regulator, partial [Actinoplanes sp. RD1]|uniref:BTAD domain-containing putative transcriptional regulator n=1 Tax=Actinoplanes sp. RD1 TaxID=3064538 RepID=UPI002742217E